MTEDNLYEAVTQKFEKKMRQVIKPNNQVTVDVLLQNFCLIDGKDETSTIFSILHILSRMEIVN
jgi:hypothetical protein